MIILLDILNSRGAPSREPRGSQRDGEAWARRADGLWKRGRSGGRSDNAAKPQGGPAGRDSATRRAGWRSKRSRGGRPGHKDLGDTSSVRFRRRRSGRVLAKGRRWLSRGARSRSKRNDARRSQTPKEQLRRETGRTLNLMRGKRRFIAEQRYRAPKTRQPPSADDSYASPGAKRGY